MGWQDHEYEKTRLARAFFRVTLVVLAGFTMLVVWIVSAVLSSD